MVRKRDKHQVAQVTEQYSDYLLLLIGVLGFASVVGALVVQVFPDAGTSGLIDLSAQFFAVSGTTITNGAALGSLAAVLGYGTNQTVDSLMNVDEAWKETEAAAALVAAGFPVAFSFVDSFQSAASGSPGMQAVFLGVYVAAMTHIVDL